MQNFARVGIFGILALVALRVGIGWHFYMEGATKVRSNNFSSEGFLVGAKGPLAPKFQELIWDHDGSLRLDQGKMNGLLNRAAERATAHFRLTDDQKKEITKLNQSFFGLNKKQEWIGKLNDVYAENEEDIYKYWESKDRIAKMEETPLWDGVESLRGQKESIENDRISGVRGALADIDAIWDQFEAGLNAIPTETQMTQSGKFTIERPGQGPLSTNTVDKIIPIFDMAVGILLMIGLLTPLAAWAAALFLISVVLSQMPGYPGTQPTYFQAVECLALIVLATTDAGRYAGLDFIPWSYWQGKKSARAAAA